MSDGTPEIKDVTPEELLATELAMTKRGYDPDAVDALLERAAATIQRLQLEAVHPPALDRRDGEDLIQRTLLLAQSTADETLEKAQENASAIVEDAEARAKRLMDDAEEFAANLMETERQRAQGIMDDVARRRERLENELDALDHFQQQARQRLLRAFDSEKVLLERLFADAMRGRPAEYLPAHGEDDIVLPDDDMDMAMSDEDPEAARVAWLVEHQSRGRGAG